jgi:hypothetical protein
MNRRQLLFDRYVGETRVSTNAVKDLQQEAREQKQRERDHAKAELVRKRREWVGTFDTGLLCLCGKPIMDEATELNPDQIVNRRDMVFGPARPVEEQNRRYQVFHRYLCTSCGLRYDNKVIETTRGYVSRDAEWRNSLQKDIKTTVKKIREAAEAA